MSLVFIYLVHKPIILAEYEIMFFSPIELSETPCSPAMSCVAHKWVQYCVFSIFCCLDFYPAHYFALKAISCVDNHKIQDTYF